MNLEIFEEVAMRIEKLYREHDAMDLSLTPATVVCLRLMGEVDHVEAQALADKAYRKAEIHLYAWLAAHPSKMETKT